MRYVLLVTNLFSVAMEPSCNLSCDILRCLTDAEIVDLISLYNRKTIYYHSTSIYNYWRWNKKIEKVDKKNIEKYRPIMRTFYTTRHGNLAINGTYISLQWDGDQLSIQFHTLEESLHELKESIIKTNLIDWKSGPLLTAIHSSCTEEIVKLVKTLGGVFEYEIPCICYVLHKKDALDVQVQFSIIPEGYAIHNLETRHADIVYKNWAHNDEASVHFIRGMIEFNKTMGIFRLRDNELIAWIFQNEFYGLGILQVIPEEQGKGFGTFLTQAMTMDIAKFSVTDTISSFAVVNNVKSKSLFSKVGFKKDCLTKWVKFKPF